MMTSARTTARSVLLTTLVGLCAGCTGGWSHQSVEPGVHGSVAGVLRYGPLDGFAQTPAGGTVGTTSVRRPT